MTLEEFVKAEGDLQNAINSINKRVRQNIDGEIDGITISKTDVMDKAKTHKTEFAQALAKYQAELNKMVK